MHPDRRFQCCRTTTTTSEKMVPMATMSTKPVVISDLQLVAITLATATNGYHKSLGAWTSSGPHTTPSCEPNPCMYLKTVVGPWRLERQTSTVSR